MNRLFQPGIQFTDPDQLQFCLPISEHEFWYCELDQTDPDSDVHRILIKYGGQPEKLLEDAETNLHIKEFVFNRTNWVQATIDTREITPSECADLLIAYAENPDDYEEGADCNQLIAEMYFETNINQFR
mgnify:FL=1